MPTRNDLEAPHTSVLLHPLGRLLPLATISALIAVVGAASVGVAEPPRAAPPAEAPADGPKKESPKDDASAPKDGKSAPGARKPWPATVPTENDILHVKPQEGLPVETYTFFGEEFRCELCLDETSRSTGMGARSEFPDGTAMIFVHPSPRLLHYWMKDCLIELDIVYVDANGRIATMYEARRERLRQKGETLEAYEARLPRYSSKRQVKYVIELPAGTIARLKPKVGERVPIDWRALDARAK
ncbi:MAG: hypothetical protein GC172_10775 [Phycisphaera sp.]|nr:hypothetical protein [Phycisphaera sp.]